MRDAATSPRTPTVTREPSPTSTDMEDGSSLVSDDRAHGPSTRFNAFTMGRLPESRTEDPVAPLDRRHLAIVRRITAPEDARPEDEHPA
eukprot:7558029-Alexandrium_andersonii.AAC.1